MPDGDSEAARDATGQEPVACQECTILIGPGYQEAIPFEFVLEADGARPRVLTVCWRCWESLNRRKVKRQAEGPEQQRSGAAR